MLLVARQLRNNLHSTQPLAHSQEVHFRGGAYRVTTTTGTITDKIAHERVRFSVTFGVRVGGWYGIGSSAELTFETQEYEYQDLGTVH